jgi:peptidoglycan/xylan/chitin deacetylase (PgdA/CDA1 family)
MTSTVELAPAGPSAFDPDHYRYERYHGERGGRSPLLSVYYGLKPALPRQVQLAVRRAYAHRQAAREFPAWPFEPVLVEHAEAELRERVLANGGEPVQFPNPWPARKRFASVLTHDVEGPLGIANIERVLEVEARHGFVSSWNFVAEWYEIPGGTFDLIRSSGCEIGLHGIKHDGRLFQSRAHFEADLPKIHEYAQAWGADGFRSPATGRNADWMHELPLAYDSSFPDSDPFEPQPGGCCSIHPFSFGEVVELPITLIQDHTLFAILRERTPRLWFDKAAWIERHQGLVNLITHPDYLADPELLGLYDEYLRHMRRREDCWHALPREAAAWWTSRGSDPRTTSAWASLDAQGRLIVET